MPLNQNYIAKLPHVMNLYLNYLPFMRHITTYKIKARQRFSWALNNPKKDNCVPMPLIYKLYLNQACDLRCPMCFLWGEKGVYSSGDERMVPAELDWQVIEKIFHEAGKDKPTFLVSGGEPLLYSRFKDFAEILKRYQTCAYITTNGVHLDKHIDCIENNPYLIFYVSLDGTKEINDRLRGPGVYEKAIANIKRLKSLRSKHYIGIQMTLMPENVDGLYEFCKEAVSLKVDWVLINLRWNLSQKQGAAYEEELLNNFGVRAWSHKGYITSSYAIDTKEFIAQCQRIKRAHWPIYISSALKQAEDLDAFINQEDENPYNNYCYKQWVRMDVLSTGEVTPCLAFPDLVFGSLKNKSISEIWNGESYKKFRQYRRQKPLSVCSKCCCLFLYDKDRVML